MALGKFPGDIDRQLLAGLRPVPSVATCSTLAVMLLAHEEGLTVGAGEQPMEWDFNFLPEHGVLSVKTSGDLDYDMMLEFISAAAVEMRRHGCDKILVDHSNAVLKISTMKVYRLPAVEVAHGIDRRRKVAVVLSPSTAREDDAQIYADLMRNNGLPHCLFGDPDAALDWLVDRK